jgi:hypothetical protein
MTVAGRVHTFGMKTARRWWTILLAVWLVIIAVPACSAASLVDTLARHDCRADATVRVSTDRTALIFVDFLVYVAPGVDRAPAANYANTLIPAALDDVNGYLDSSGVNVVLVLHGGQLTEEAAMAPVDLTDKGFPEVASLEIVKDAARANPKNVQSHWSPSSDQPNVTGYATGQVEDRVDAPLMWLGMIENPAGSPHTAQQRKRTFAHELGHYFGLAHRTDLADNLMNQSGTGEALLASQIQTMWNTLNTQRANLAVISCLRDPALRRVAREHRGDQIPDAVGRRGTT